PCTRLPCCLALFLLLHHLCEGAGQFRAGLGPAVTADRAAGRTSLDRASPHDRCLDVPPGAGRDGLSTLAPGAGVNNCCRAVLCCRSLRPVAPAVPAPVPPLSHDRRGGAELPIEPAAGGRTGPLAWGPMTPSRPAPPQYPTTATLMLLATPGDPFVQASARAGTAHRAITELLELLPADQQQLPEQFHPAARATLH